MEVNKKADKKVRVVHRETGTVSFIHSSYAYDKIWQKRTKNRPEPEPKAENFKPVTGVKAESPAVAEATKDLSKETKKETNAKSETVKNG